jgi:Asp-tRNA(Asn)/Glu-tRNA(Gln) amidotransferase C subunit
VTVDSSARPSSAGTPLEHLAAHARLPIPADRAEAIAVQVDAITALIDQLDALDLAETPPATAFDARWQ